MSPAQRRVLALVLLSGGAAALSKLQAQLREARREQQELSKGVEPRRGPRQAPVAVNALFARRLKAILRICVPSPLSAEAGLIYTQSVLLILRSLLTEYISRLEGRAGRWIIAQNAPQLTRTLLQFVAVCLPAAITNSGLKYLQRRIKIGFQRRLTLRLHEHLCQHRAYYLASTLGGLTMVDQRITEDVERFAHTVSELYPYTFKPLLDVALFTRSLSRMMGYKRQFALYGYYLLAAQVLRAASPPLALMTAQEAALGGAFRGAHQRLVQHAEEIAFNDPPAGMAERMILDQSLYRLLRHSRLSALLQFVQQSLDGFFIKYGATAVALCIFALPLYRPSAAAGAAGGATADYVSGSQGERTGQYISAMRLLSNTSRAIGDLVLVYKRVTGLAGHTSRVSELLERVSGLASADEEGTMRSLYLRNVSSSGVLLPTSASGDSLAPLPEPRRLEGEAIKFERVYLASPDGHELVRELSFEVLPGRSVIIQGPNGSGKSSLFRVAAGLWPLQAGEVVMPPRGELFYLSQRPYLVAGTLRDQLLYPEPPQAVYAAAKSERTRARIEPWMKSLSLSEEELEDRLCECLEAVELDYLLIRGRGWNQVQPWRETLSGGEQQRLAMARLLFHRPTYAILDECTSAVSADGEQRLIGEAVRRGITMLSIGHRPALRRFHSVAVHFEGSGQWRLEQLRGSDAEGLVEEPPNHSHQQ
ncbi:ABC transporter D family [Micractinium conductrix]|uniref:ABC transporter D family n=1 Tax=Micractinium conductrix TaxID=554055 RepID=A0A2P6VDB4_9CHLO|nr:ABC transporter D family [Micractinium conductrix]|eukprot:PSC72069.1 ABC transporter D family [Micractinium conductrix]